MLYPMNIFGKVMGWGWYERMVEENLDAGYFFFDFIFRVFMR